MSQPKWRTIYNTDYSLLQEDETGVYEPEMEIADQVDEDKDGNPLFNIYRFSVDRMKLVSDDKNPNKFYLVPYRYDESYPYPAGMYEAWWVKHLKGIASAVGSSVEDLVEAVTSEDPGTRAEVYEAIGSVEGYMNLDTDPLTDLTEEDLNERWKI